MLLLFIQSKMLMDTDTRYVLRKAFVHLNSTSNKKNFKHKKHKWCGHPETKRFFTTLWMRVKTTNITTPVLQQPWIGSSASGKGLQGQREEMAAVCAWAEVSGGARQILLWPRFSPIPFVRSLHIWVALWRNCFYCVHSGKPKAKK